MPHVTSPESVSRHAARGVDTKLAGGKLDALDIQIIELLQKDGRMPYRQIARELDVSEGTVRFRTNRMQTTGSIAFEVTPDPRYLGYALRALALIKTVPSSHAAVAEHLASWEESVYVASLASSADLLFQFVGKDNQHLHEILYGRVATLEGVIGIEVHVEVKVHKAGFQAAAERG